MKTREGNARWKCKKLYVVGRKCPTVEKGSIYTQSGELAFILSEPVATVEPALIFNLQHLPDRYCKVDRKMPQ